MIFSCRASYQDFPNGAPEGVIAPEAANNSAISASLAPALMLGIPGGATTALLLVALTVHGIRPGTLLFANQPGLVYGFLVGLLIGLPLEWYAVRVILQEETGFTFPVRVPWAAAGVVAGLAVVTATLAGLGPAFQAMRLRIPEAIAYE